VPDELAVVAAASRAGIFNFVPTFIAVGSTLGFAFAIERHAFSLPR
jgi:hypothetical protein